MAVGGFVAAAVIRGVTISALLLAIGAIEEPLWAYRIVASLISVGVVLMIVAVLISTMRAHTRSLETLLKVQRDLAARQDDIVAEVAERNEETLARVKTRLTDEMVALESLGEAGSVAELQRLASDVVRPMSHELAGSLRLDEPDEVLVDDVHVTPQQVITQMVTVAPFRPGMTGLLLTVIMLTAALGVFGMRGVPLLVVTVASVILWSWLGNRVLRHVLPRLTSGRALAAVIGTALVAGYLTSAVAGWVLRGTSDAAPMVVLGGAFVAAMILLLALVSAVLRQQVATERDLAASSERLRWSVVRMRQVQWLQGQALSRALHGPVQAAVTSAALRLDAAVRAGRPTESLLEEIRTDLRTTVDVLDAPELVGPPLQEALARIIGTWAGICDVSAQVDRDVRECLDADRVAGSTVVDLLTEAVSNAVRHGGATRVDVRVEGEGPDVIRLTVRDDGSPASGSLGAGLGTSLLEGCTLEWSRTEVPGGQVLEALLPCPATPDLVGGRAPR